MKWCFRLLALALLLGGGSLPAADEVATFAPEQVEFFEKEIRPALIEHCGKCHTGDQQKGGLSLTSRDALLKGGDTGPAIVPGKPDESELLKAINYDPAGYQMPPSGKLPDELVAKFTTWVQMGAPWPKDRNVAQAGGAAWPELFAKRSQYWAFQPLTRPVPPTVSNLEWSRTPIDRFVLQGLDRAELRPAAETDRRTWLRRASYYATGLPPKPAEIEAFLSDQSPDAYEHVVDRLLASPHFGERWGRHWLDLARYAESRGHEFDYDVANPWPYRDFVIRAMNEDVPYDRFVVEQVAGDLLPIADASKPANGRYPARFDQMSGSNESLVATGFWLFGEWVHSPVDIRKEEAERFDNMLDVYGKTFLGLTIACARCHDHKFDPISQRDYYALSGYLQSCSYAQRPYNTLGDNLAIKARLADLDRRGGAAIATAVREAAEPVTARLDDYLLAARAVLKQEGRAEGAPLDDARIEAEAKARSLDPRVLRAWSQHLASRPAEGSDPFSWLSGATPWDDLPAAGAERESTLAMRLESLAPAPPDDGPGIRVLATDGAAFSIAGPPRDAERAWLGTDATSLLRLIPARDESCLDPDFADTRTAPGVMNEPGAVGRTPRGGRTLRTASFLIETDRIACWVRGGCSTYLSVDSHITINGPLHGRLIQEHAADVKWHWIEVDTSRYRGHKAHLEFLIPAGTDFGVRRVTQATAKPAAPLPPGAEQPEIQLKASLRNERPATLEAAVRIAKSLWSQQTDLRLADWMLRHPVLFGLVRTDGRPRIAEAAEPFLTERQRLVSQIRRESQLALCLLDGSAEDEPLHVRGNPGKPGDIVPRRFLEVFAGRGLDAAEGGSGRLPLALQMVDPAQTPILARVIVNRLWHHAFGRGLVPTVDDFGHMGQPPSHPELLDWLATELVRRDWSLKDLHRMILLSATFRMQTIDNPATASRVEQVDPQNLLLHRMNVLRIEGESIRDAVLAISGRLDERLYGASTPIHLTSFLEGRGRPGTSGPVDGEGRRSLYLSIRRNFQEPFLVAFDFPTPHTSIGRRSVSNVPAQALALLNNPLIQEQTRRWAANLSRDTSSPSSEARIRAMYESTYARLPTDAEVSLARDFLTAAAADLGTSPDSEVVWAELCHALINAKEFVYLR